DGSQRAAWPKAAAGCTQSKASRHPNSQILMSISITQMVITNSCRHQTGSYSRFDTRRII
ncbi:MAG: hypothetical protein ABI162_00875, partial [Luteolibacter sp.]